MDITPKVDSKTNIISGYSSDKIFINTVAYSKKVFLSTTDVFEHNIENVSTLTIDDLSWIVKEIIENNIQVEAVVLIGYDEDSLSSHIRQELTKKSIGFEVMSAQAAYRTYNILAVENRRIYAVLF